MCLSSTENGDRASKFVHWVVEAGRELQVTPTVFIGKEKIFPPRGVPYTK